MIRRSRRRLRVQRILEPGLCLRCPFAWLIEAQDRKGEYRPKFYCARGDCDNWVTQPEGESPDSKIDPANSASF